MFFLRRLIAPGSRLQKVTLGLITALLVSMVGFIIATSLQCDLLAPWNIVGVSCPSWVSSSRAFLRLGLG